MTTLTPSPARTYTVLASAPNTPVNGIVPVITVSPKGSADITDYSFDFTQWLAGTNDTLLSDVALNGASSTDVYPIEVVQSSITGNVVTILIASGQPNTTNVLGVSIATTQGRAMTLPFVLTIDNSSVATPAPVVVAPTSPTGGITADQVSAEVIQTITNMVGKPNGLVGLSPNGNISINGVETFGVKNGKLYLLAPLGSTDPSSQGELYNNGGVISISQP